MSGYYFKLIPIVPEYVPDAASQKRALERFASFVRAAEVSAAATDNVQFHCAMGNFESVACPACGRDLDLDWWNDAMNVACESQFSDLRVVVPCCGVTTSLNELRYRFPQGFSRFVLSARYPGANLDDEQFRELERILGCALRKLWIHV